MKILTFFLFSLLTFYSFGQRPRVVVLTDGEVDDQSSMVRFLLYTNELDVEAIIETNSVFQRNGHSKEDWLEKQLEAYGKDYSNLIVHDPNYPTEQHLKSKCFIGDEDSTHIVVDRFANKRFPGGKVLINPDNWADTPGSDKIVEILLRDDPRPVFIQAWGGGNTAARAFAKLKKQYPSQYEKAVAKVVMYNIWYQDGAGHYIEKYHPTVTMLISYHFTGTWAYGSQSYTNQFVTQKLKSSTGNLGKLYPQNYISEGDTPSFLYSIPNGLRSFENPTYGGWGGLFYKVAGFQNIYRDANKGSYARWIEYVNNDFEARLKWCESPKYENANHKPVVRLKKGENITVKSGDKVIIESEFNDPDPINLEALWEMYGAIFLQQGLDKSQFAEKAKLIPQCVPYWWQFEGAGTYQGFLQLQQTDESNLIFIAPKVNKRSTIHLVLEVSDSGHPKLTQFRRVIVTVLP